MICQPVVTYKLVFWSDKHNQITTTREGFGARGEKNQSNF
jgi:hypothetical protein